MNTFQTSVIFSNTCKYSLGNDTRLIKLCFNLAEFLAWVPENPPIKLLYFVVKSYKSPIFLLICSYFSYNIFLKMAGMYGIVKYWTTMIIVNLVIVLLCHFYPWQINRQLWQNFTVLNITVFRESLEGHAIINWTSIFGSVSCCQYN